jgi:formyltetrahydrofolate hydrolase
MLGEAHAGILFHPPENVIREFPQFPVTQSYAELRAEIDKAFSPVRPGERLSPMHAKRFYTLSGSCPDQIGIIARVSGFIAQHRGWILESSYHADDGSGENDSRYFMRMEVKADSLPFHLAEFRERFRPLAEDLSMNWKISDSAVKRRVVIMVSKQEHCLYDLLSRWQAKELDIEIPCVISNHDTFKAFVEWHGIPFHYVPVNPDNKQAAYAEDQPHLRRSQGRHDGPRALHADSAARAL